MIQIKDVTFSYGKQHPIYENLNLTINKQESVAILGFNGAGKSTLMKLLLGILHPQTGTIMIDDRNVHKKRKKVMQYLGIVWGQKPTLWWDISIKRSYDTLAKIYHIPKQEYLSTLAALDNELKVSEYWDKALRNVSLGQRVKAEIMGVLLHNPSILVLDEPFIGLDFMTREKIIGVLQKYLEERTCTMLLTSHNIDDVSALSDRLILIEHGKIIHDGNIQALLQESNTIKDILVTHTTDKLQLKDEYCKYIETCTKENDITKITFNTKEIDYIEFMKAILNDNPIQDIRVESVSLQYIVKNMILK